MIGLLENVNLGDHTSSLLKFTKLAEEPLSLRPLHGTGLGRRRAREMHRKDALLQQKTGEKRGTVILFRVEINSNCDTTTFPAETGYRAG